MSEVWCETCQDYHVVDLTDDDVVVQARRDGCEIRLDDDEEIVVPALAGSPSAIVAWLRKHFD